jgi:hypothetical protein
MKLIFLFIFISLFASHSGAQDSQQLVNQAIARGLHLSKQWQRLLHYRRTAFGYRGEADGLSFYISPEGRTNPEAELRATLAGFFHDEKRILPPPTPALTARCQYPARFRWLNLQLNFASREPQPCKEFEEFKERVNAKSATLIFSSFHSQNPSSVFGHTLLRLNQSGGLNPSRTERSELLDYGINFAANPNTSNPILYAFLGFAGGFPGTFTSLPYYYKVREYADFDSRDLWEYDLSLNTDEITRLVEHLWELGPTYFDYFYLSKNCSYQILALIEAAAPRLDLLTHVPWWVIPTDTLKAVAREPGLVLRTRYRPSIHTQFMHRLSLLNSNEREKLHEFLNSHSTDLSGIQDAASASRIADTYIDYIDLHHSQELFEKDPAISGWKQALLVSRSHLPIDETPPAAMNPSEAPDRSHGSARAILYGAQNSVGQNALGVSIRFALHDILDPTAGLPDTSEIDFFRLGLRAREKSHDIVLNDYSFLGVSTYLPIDSFHRQPSWRFAFTSRRLRDDRCEDCLPLAVAGAAGATWAPLSSHRILIYGLLEGRAETSEMFASDRVTFLTGPAVGIKTQLGAGFALGAEAKWLQNLNAPSFAQLDCEAILRKSFQGDWLLETRSRWTDHERDVTLGIGKYF